MFNLVKYRFLFIALSLLVIVPGVIVLAIFHLKIGIDFAGGSTVTLRPQTPVTLQQATALLKPLKLPDMQVTTGDLGANPSQAGNKTVWIRLNTTIDSNVLNNISGTLTSKYPGINTPLYEAIPSGQGNKNVGLLIVTGFKNTPQVSDIKSALSKIPNTTSSSAPATSTGTNPVPAAPTQAATSSAKNTPTAQGTAKATATSTPAATATPTSTQSASANIPVNVTDVSQGTTTKTINILTSKQVQSDYVWSSIQPQFLQHNGPYVQLISNQSVGGSVASDTVRNAVFAVIAASLFILLYVWFAFRKVNKPWRYGACAIIALLHDVLVVLGIFSILGELFNLQVDALFITALLTVIGFSVHDTIVVFDRIRENMQRRTGESFETVVNASLVQTMTRSLNTSLTVILTLLTLTLFAGPGSTIFTFTLTLLIGITSGTYSSIFNASMLLVVWENGEMGFDKLGGGNKGKDLSPRKREREVRELAGSR
ncbi:MAG TPA: protein translocase subunit SecF [Ktedonobacteraceae bacterium]|nr:protein translocase subunit SecF [Ktedonobacteraceae bacterium]